MTDRGHLRQVEETLPATLTAVPAPRTRPKSRRSSGRLDREIPTAPDDPACWSWPPFRGRSSMTPRKQIGMLYAWHKGRCGICAMTPDELVTDHSHRTAKVRGLLCDSCNLTEGKDREPEGVFARWRAYPSTTILRLDITYVNPVSGEVAVPLPDKPLGPEFLPEWAPCFRGRSSKTLATSQTELTQKLCTLMRRHRYGMSPDMIRAALADAVLQVDGWTDLRPDVLRDMSSVRPVDNGALLSPTLDRARYGRL